MEARIESMEESDEPVQVIESCLVTPREATPTEGLRLSPIDVSLANAGRIPQVFLYRSGATFFDVPKLKEAMARALVAYYPLAGRLGNDGGSSSGSSRVVSCNGEGALFVVARSRCLTQQDVDFSKPSPELNRMFVPNIEPAATLILVTQVTFLKCGAVVLGVSMHHAVLDGVSASHFMQTWSALYRNDGEESTTAAKDDELPCHDRTLLRARSPPVVHPDALSVLYYPKVVRATCLPPSPSAPETFMTTEVFPISRDQVAALKRLCGGAGSTFVSLSALVWQCASVVRRLPPDAITRLSFPVHVQRYLTPPLPTRYFGNACISLCATGAAGDIASEALPSVAARISGAMARMDDELVRSAIDFAELADEDTWPRCRGGVLPETDLRIVSWLNMPFGLDLGCGGPQVMTRADTLPHGIVYLIDDDHRGVAVVLRMEVANINEFKRLLYASTASALHPNKAAGTSKN